MSYRHHLAQLESFSTSAAVYTFTPDSITCAHWGRVEFDLTDFSHRITELAPDPNAPDVWQQRICSVLAHRLRQARTAEPELVPKTLEFVV